MGFGVFQGLLGLGFSLGLRELHTMEIYSEELGFLMILASLRLPKPLNP